MSKSKSWIVANVEVILITFTVIFLIITSLVVIPSALHKEGGTIPGRFLFFVSIILCALFVYAVRHGFKAFLVILFFLALFTAEAISEDKDNTQQTGTEVSASVQNRDSNSNGNELRMYLLKAGKKLQWKWLLWISISATIFGLFTAVYANVRFDDVVSRRFFYRNSFSSEFADRWKYTFNRFYAGFVTLFTMGIEILLYVLFLT